MARRLRAAKSPWATFFLHRIFQFPQGAPHSPRQDQQHGSDQSTDRDNDADEEDRNPGDPGALAGHLRETRRDQRLLLLDQ